MAPGDDHSSWEELAVGHALSALEPTDEDAFAEHVRTCTECANTVAETGDVMGELADAVEDVNPPPALRGRILSLAVSERDTREDREDREDGEDTAGTGTVQAGAVEDTAADDSPDELSRHRARYADSGGGGWRQGLRVPWYGVAASIVVLLVLAAGNVVLLLQNDAQQTNLTRAEQVVNCVEGPQCRALPLRATDGEAVPVMALVQDGDVQLMVDGLKTNDADSTMYVLWQKSGEQPPQAVSAFDVTRTGVTEVSAGNLGAPLEDTAFLAVSHETGQQPPEKPSTPLAVGKVSRLSALEIPLTGSDEQGGVPIGAAEPESPSPPPPQNGDPASPSPSADVRPPAADPPDDGGQSGLGADSASCSGCADPSEEAGEQGEAVDDGTGPGGGGERGGSGPGFHGRGHRCSVADDCPGCQPGNCAPGGKPDRAPVGGRGGAPCGDTGNGKPPEHACRGSSTRP